MILHLQHTAVSLHNAVSLKRMTGKPCQLQGEMRTPLLAGVVDTCSTQRGPSERTLKTGP